MSDRHIQLNKILSSLYNGLCMTSKNSKDMCQLIIFYFGLSVRLLYNFNIGHGMLHYMYLDLITFPEAQMHPYCFQTNYKHAY